MVVNMQQITFMYGVEAAEAMIKKAWPVYQFKDRTYLDGSSTLCGICSWRDFHGFDDNNNLCDDFIAENTR